MDYIFDTHAHYDDEAFDADREEVLTGLKKQGIGTVVNVGVRTHTEALRRSLRKREDHSAPHRRTG